MGEINTYYSDFKEYMSSKKSCSYGGYQGSNYQYQSSYYIAYFYEMSSMNRGYLNFKSYDELEKKMGEFGLSIPEDISKELKKNGLHYVSCKPFCHDLLIDDSYYGMKSKLESAWNECVFDLKRDGKVKSINEYIKDCKENLYVLSTYNPFKEKYKIKYYVDSCKDMDMFIGFDTINDFQDFLSINKLEFTSSNLTTLEESFNDIETFHMAKSSSYQSQYVSMSKYSFESVENLVNYNYSRYSQSSCYGGYNYNGDYDD